MATFKKIFTVLLFFSIAGVSYYLYQGDGENPAGVSGDTPNISQGAEVTGLEGTGSEVLRTTTTMRAPVDKPGEKLDSVAALVEGLRQRLESEPDDMKGWVLLAQSYHHLQRWQEAENAFKKARTLGYTGVAPASPAGAVASDTKSKARSSVSNNRLVLGPNNTLLSDYFRDSVVSETASPEHPVGSSTDQGLKLRVTLSPSLGDYLPSEAVVFIFARSLEGGGGPLAVLKRSVSDLPLDVLLDDSMAMIPDRKISSFKEVVVGARVSLSGQPMRQEGDFEAISAPISSSYEGVLALTIGNPASSAGVN